MMYVENPATGLPRHRSLGLRGASKYRRCGVVHGWKSCGSEDVVVEPDGRWDAATWRSLASRGRSCAGWSGIGAIAPGSADPVDANWT